MQFLRARLVHLLLAAAVLGGCAPETAVETLGTAREEQVVCAGPNVVEGVDVSTYQGNVDWSAVAGSGRVFAIARTNDGTITDSKFAQNWAGMQAAGLVRGAYQFFEPGDDPAWQAQVVTDAIGGVLQEGDLPVVLDLEKTGGQTPDAIVAAVHVWVDAVRASTGRDPLVYTGHYFFDTNVASSDFVDLGLWIPNWGVTCPNTPDPWTSWVLWQYSSTGSVSGISGGVDVDQFNGSIDELVAFARAPFGAQLVAQSIPGRMAPGQRSAASLTFQNIGSGSWNTGTHLATTVERDRASIFAGSDWDAPNQLDTVSGVVLPGDSFTFSFELAAPATPGTYTEHIGLVQDGLAWFGDPGQGGPADDTLALVIDVAEDTGAGGGGGSVGATGTTTGTGGDATPRQDEATGCACRLGTSPASLDLPWITLLGLAASLVAARRRFGGTMRAVR